MSKRKHNLSIDHIPNTSRRLNRSIIVDPPKKQLSPFKKISDIPNIRSYVAIEKLKLGKQALQKIKESLDIDHVSEVNFGERIKNNDYYINYQKNPFLAKNEKQQPSDLGPAPGKKRSFGSKSHNIVESINNLKAKSQFKQIMSKLVKQESQSNYIHKTMQDKRRQEQKAIKKKRYQEKSIIIQQNGLPITDRKINDFQDFQRIVKIKEESFYRKKNRNKSFNIFKILTDDTDSNFYLSSSILKKVYFCEDSTVTKANAKKITNVFKDISFVSRLLINNLNYLVPKDYKMVPADLKTVTEQIKFSDFMLLSSGFIEPQVLQSYLSQQVRNTKRGGTGDEQGTSLVEESDQIFYMDNQKNVSALFQIERHDKAEIQTYIDHPFSKIENKQLVLSQMHKNQLLKYLHLEQSCKGINVQDQQLLKQINQKKRRILIEQFQGRIRNQNGSIDKIIRLNKRKKDRVQNIKNKMVVQTIQQQKSIQKKIRQSSKHHNSVSIWR